MKRFFVAAMAAFALGYVVAETTLPREADDGVARIRWATDPNPARNLQVEIFGKMQVRLDADDVADAAGLCRALAAGAGRGPVAGRIWGLLPADARSAAERIATSGEAAGKDLPALLGPLNELLDRRDLFAREDLTGLALSRDAEGLLARPREELSNVEAVALNRRVVEAAFSGLVATARRIEATVESGAREKLIVQCATGTGPDVIDVYGKLHMMTLVEAGVLVDLTPYAARMGFGPENTYPALKGGLVVDGKQYRFPCNVWANCVIYNRKVLDDHGVAYPTGGWTYDDLIRIGKRIVAEPGHSGERHLAVANFSSEWMFNDFLIGHGGRYFTPDGLVSLLDAPEALAAMQLYHDLMHVHKVFPTPAEAAAMSSQGGWGTGAITWFSTGRAGLIFIGRWYLCQVVNYPDIVQHLGAVRLPAVAGREPAGVADARGAGINISSRHKAEALEFVRYLASREYGQVIVNDGDSLPPNPALARSGRDLVNATAADPNFHQPFVDAIVPARPLDASAFIDNGQVARWLREMLSKVENRIVSPAAGLKTLAGEINQRIRRNLRRRGDLQRKYEQVTGRPYRDDWRRQKP